MHNYAMFLTATARAFICLADFRTA